MKKQLVAALAILLSGFSVTLVAAPVNVNTASAEEMAQALHGIGAVKAEAIIAQREAAGPFKSASDLTMVKGIGPKTVEKNRDDIQL